MLANRLFNPKFVAASIEKMLPIICPGIEQKIIKRLIAEIEKNVNIENLKEPIRLQYGNFSKFIQVIYHSSGEDSNIGPIIFVTAHSIDGQTSFVNEVKNGLKKIPGINIEFRNDFLVITFMPEFHTIDKNQYNC